MKQRVVLVKKILRIAELVEKQAIAEFAAAERAVDEAVRALAELRRESEAAEARLLSGQGLSGFEREMLWGHRVWFVQAEREALVEIGRLEALAAVAKTAADAARREARMREKLRERVVTEYRTEYERKANKELDEVGARRFGAPDVRRDS